MKKLLNRIRLVLLTTIPFGVSAQGPIHFWPLDELNGLVAPDLNGGAHGTLQNGPTWVSDGYLGNGLTFDGVDDRVDLGPLDITSGSGFSIACWVRPSSTTLQDQLLVAKAYDPLIGDFVWSIGTSAHTKVTFRLGTIGPPTQITSPPNSIFPSAFYHLAATYDGSQMHLYINGALAASAPKTGMLGYHPQALASMGHLDIGPGVVPFAGTLGDVRIWDRGLSQSEIFDLVLEQDISMNTADVLQPAHVPTGPAQLLDISGRLLRSFNSGASALHTDDLPPGLYVLLWRDGDRVCSAKWMKP
jgi:Concanavalin A-like lectin/glucanases superfamily